MILPLEECHEAARFLWLLFPDCALHRACLCAAQVALKNGNQVVGDIQLSALKLKTGLGVMDVPINEIKAVQGNNITLGDGTTLTGSIVDRSFGVQTRYGLVTIQTQDIKGIVNMAPPGAQVGLSPKSSLSSGVG